MGGYECPVQQCIANQRKSEAAAPRSTPERGFVLFVRLFIITLLSCDCAIMCLRDFQSLTSRSSIWTFGERGQYLRRFDFWKAFVILSSLCIRNKLRSSLLVKFVTNHKKRMFSNFRRKSKRRLLKCYWMKETFATRGLCPRYPLLNSS